jgi:hypothetical protein
MCLATIPSRSISHALEQRCPRALNVVGVPEARVRTTAREQDAQCLLSFDQGRATEVLTVPMQQIEGDEVCFPSSEQRVLEVSPPVIVQAHNLTVQHGGIHV